MTLVRRATSSAFAVARAAYRVARPAFAFLAMFSGIALLLNILADISLPLALAFTTSGMIVGLNFVMAISTPWERRRVWHTIAVAVPAGLLATLTYDLSKALLSLLDPSPYNPFEVIRIFGGLLVGPNAAPSLIVISGAAFHLLNGTAFGVAYTFLFARDGHTSVPRALVTGIGWGIFLETFQLTLYPGWLDIRLYAEFATISALGHVVYGGTLGILSRTLLRATDSETKMHPNGPSHSP